MRRILYPNNGEDIVMVDKNHVFVSITDFGLKTVLKEIIVSPGQHHWEWISFAHDRPVELTELGSKYSSFDNALNRAINDPYCTVYEFVTLEDIIWDHVEFVDKIETVYKSEEGHGVNF